MAKFQARISRVSTREAVEERLEVEGSKDGSKEAAALAAEEPVTLLAPAAGEEDAKVRRRMNMD